MNKFRRSSAGFTLIELLIVVVMIAILAAIAFPQYRDYVVRSNRAVAKSMLVQVADRQEQFFTDRKTYADDMTDLGYPGASSFVVDRAGRPAAADAGGALYTITLSDETATTYTLTATPLNGQTEDTQCATIVLNQAGQRTSTPGGDCW
ncbi:MAG: type IV pilin protein [Gammaproteobacteria bacterium]